MELCSTPSLKPQAPASSHSRAEKKSRANISGGSSGLGLFPALTLRGCRSDPPATSASQILNTQLGREVSGAAPIVLLEPYPTAGVSAAAPVTHGWLCSFPAWPRIRPGPRSCSTHTHTHRHCPSQDLFTAQHSDFIQ